MTQLAADYDANRPPFARALCPLLTHLLYPFIAWPHSVYHPSLDLTSESTFARARSIGVQNDLKGICTVLDCRMSQGYGKTGRMGRTDQCSPFSHIRARATSCNRGTVFCEIAILVIGSNKSAVETSTI